jgi:hypothetical protein
MLTRDELGWWLSLGLSHYGAEHIEGLIENSVLNPDSASAIRLIRIHFLDSIRTAKRHRRLQSKDGEQMKRIVKPL